ncbi:hypothetical protein Slin15195_G092340 [Septoria linicola]|uniref:DUF7587 domain-containing protein n=1 Tax=Septoria linicola TaxID=215465 RepID=A0A9Q9B0I4_9PEZI|nr:hypothetical protein Slin15195_G092340 [Septoria linicola]
MTAANTKKKLVKRGPRINWTHEMRVALHLIISEFELQGKQRATIFNTIFAAELSQYGLPEGTRIEVLKIQYDMRKYPEKYKYWPIIMAPPTTQAEADVREAVRAQIRQAVQHATDSRPRKAPGSSSRSAGQEKPRILPQGDNIKVARVMHTPLRASVRPRPEDVTTPAPMPQTPSPTKRRIAVDGDSDLEHEPAVPSLTPDRKRTRVVERVYQPLLESPNRGETARRHAKYKPVTPPQQSNTPKGKYIHTRGDGTNVVVSDKRRNILGQSLVPVPHDIAQPPLPWLLFRYYEEQNPRDHNGEDGFMARKYFQSLPPPLPPKSVDLDMKDVLNHMDRRTQETPFISTCNKLLWIVQLAIKEAKRGVSNGRIALLDPAVIGQRAIFWAPPFHREIADKSAEFRNGAFRYCGNYEFLVWGSIPREAIITTVKVTDLLRLPQLQPVIGNILRFDVLRSHAALGKKEAEFKSHGIRLDSTTAAGIARLTRFLGLTSKSPVQHLSHIVADVVRGWHLSVIFQEPRAWRKLASDFARALAGDHWMEPEKQQSLKLAFLDGIRWSQGDFNARHKVELMAAMQRKARLIGLEFPAKIVSDELDAWKVRLFTHENNVARLLGGNARQPLLGSAITDMVEDNESEDDDGQDRMVESEDEREAMPTPGPSRPKWSWTRRMRIEDDEYQHDAGEEIQYELDD